MPTALLASVRRLSRSREARFAARAWLAAPAVQTSLAVAGFARTLRWIEALPARPAALPVDVAAGERRVAHAYRAHVVGGACLARSLTQYLLHRRDGLPVRLVVGVRREGRGVAAHAWVEHRDAARRFEPGFEPLFLSPPRGAP